MSDENKGGTRVFKKTSPNGKITTYLGKRDFIDHLTHVDTIDGMVLVDPEYVAESKKVYANLLAAFRYGREDLDVLGLQFRKDLFTSNMQVFPPDPAYKDKQLTRLQERLKKKLGEHAYPFWFEVIFANFRKFSVFCFFCNFLFFYVPPNSASSVTLQPAPGDTGKPCGVDYELNTFVADNLTEKPKKQNCVRLAIRKLTYAACDKTRPQPSVESSKEFMMSPGLLHLEASLDKELYNHGESISVNVHIQNNSNKSVKKLKAAVLQIADICLFTTASYSCEVAKLESGEGFPVGPGSTLSKVYTLCPLLANNKDKRGLALDGKLKHEDTNLASSTIMAEGALKENLGIIVQYKVKIRLTLGGALGGEMTAELPFTLTHPKPPESPKPTARSPSEPVVDMDLIQLDTNLDGRNLDDDIIFEDFARLRLKGADSEDHDG